MNINKHTSDIWSISNFWSSEVCDACINKTDAAGLFPTSPDQLHDLSNIEDNISSNSRIYFTSNELAQSIWMELHNLVPQQYKKSKAVVLMKLFVFINISPGRNLKNIETMPSPAMSLRKVFIHC